MWKKAYHDSFFASSSCTSVLEYAKNCISLLFSSLLFLLILSNPCFPSIIQGCSNTSGKVILFFLFLTSNFNTRSFAPSEIVYHTLCYRLTSSYIVFLAISLSSSLSNGSVPLSIKWMMIPRLHRSTLLS